MERNDSRYEVDATGTVRLAMLDSPKSKHVTDPSSPFKSPQSPVVEDDETDAEARTRELVDHSLMDSLVSIAQPLKQHGSVFIGKLASAGGSPTPPPPPHSLASRKDAELEMGGTPSTASPPVSATASPAQKKPLSAASQLSHVHSFLCTVPHLCTLTIDQLVSLRVMVREYDALDNVIETGVMLQHVYVLAGGTVEVFDMKQYNRAVSHKRIASITAPNIFGMESIVFDRPSEFSYSASSANTTILLIGKAQFLELFRRNNIFAHSVGSHLTLGMPQFNVFQDFCRSVFAMSSVVAAETSFAKCEGYTLHLPSILENYGRIGTIIHPLINKPEIDVNALAYACARLPANITETFVINLARSLPPFLASELRNRQAGECANGASFAGGQSTQSSNGNVTYVSTSNRRRSSWRIGDKGHTLILMRDGFTDAVDFMTSFCIHIIEARKLRIRLQSMISPSAADVLRDAIVAIHENQLSMEEMEELQRHVLGQLPLTPIERAGLSNMWPHSAVDKLYNIIMHQEQYIVKVDTSLSKRFTLDAYFHWGVKIRSQLHRMLQIPETDPIPTDVEIAILSSRNRSTKNLLCSMVETQMTDILDYIAQSSDIEQLQFPDERDRLYYALFRMINEDDQLRAKYKNVLRACGFAMFEDYMSSGLQLDLIDLKLLNPDAADPYLRETVSQVTAAPTRRFMINIDFTFGAQAEGIMRSLFLIFGHHIRSVNVVGKCAGITGNRGDILLPKKLIFSKAAFGEDTTDEIRDCGNQGISAGELHKLVKGSRNIHEGACITIPGMILQNEVLIKFYKLVFQAAGMEMEGSYIARQIEECANLGLIRSDVETRFTFYMSDMPLGNEDGTKFNVRTKSAESIATMYASLRATLRAILSGV